MLNQKGQALVIVLLFSLVGTLFVVMVLYLVLRGTEMSGMQKRFQTSLDAAHAGVSVEKQFLEQGTFFSIDSPIFQGTNVSVNPAAGTCFFQKVFQEYGTWNLCSAAESSLNAKQSPDYSYDVNGVNNDYGVFTKIVDTRRGLTATRPPGVEEPTGVAYGGELGLDISEQAYIFYTVELLSEDNFKGEVARISFDYAW
jgi:hypothetical protein